MLIVLAPLAAISNTAHDKLISFRNKNLRLNAVKHYHDCNVIFQLKIVTINILPSDNSSSLPSGNRGFESNFFGDIQ